MAPLFSLISQLTPKTMFWALKVRLVRCYELPNFGKDKDDINSMECIFHDQEGSRIHATIKKQNLKSVALKFKEGKLYAIKDVIVADNSMKIKTTTDKFKISFVSKTQVCEIFDDTFPSYIYKFKPFVEVKSEDVDKTNLFDVIGKVVARDIPQFKEIGGRDTKLINIVIEDNKNNQLSCTLWGDFVDDFMSYFGKEIKEEPFIIILQMCHANTYKGEIRVSNTYHITKMIINEESDVVADFRNRLSSESNTPNSVSTISLLSANNIIEEISASKDNFRTIEQISENHEVGSFWILAKIAIVETNGDWCYLSCFKCSKKMTPIGDSFYCEKCHQFDANGKLRFKIQVRVVDDIGNALFLMWDRECIQLIGKTTMDLRSQSLNNKEFQLGEIPKEIEDLVDRKVLFKIQVKPGQTLQFNGSYTVMKLTCDSNIIDKLCGEILESQEPDIFSNLQRTEHGEIKEICSSEDEVTTPMKTTTKIVRDEMMKDSNLKRCLIDEFSSTAPGKKMKKMIKREKD